MRGHGTHLFIKFETNQGITGYGEDMDAVSGTTGLVQRIAYLAHLYYVPMAPHMVALPLGAMGACHCCAAVPNFLCCEWHWISRWERWDSLIEEDPLIQNGYITVSEKPGIGVTLNEDAVKEFAVEGMPFFE